MNIPMTQYQRTPVNRGQFNHQQPYLPMHQAAAPQNAPWYGPPTSMSFNGMHGFQQMGLFTTPTPSTLSGSSAQYTSTMPYEPRSMYLPSQQRFIQGPATMADSSHCQCQCYCGLRQGPLDGNYQYQQAYSPSRTERTQFQTNLGVQEQLSPLPTPQQQNPLPQRRRNTRNPLDFKWLTSAGPPNLVAGLHPELRKTKAGREYLEQVAHNHMQKKWELKDQETTTRDNLKRKRTASAESEDVEPPKQREKIALLQGDDVEPSEQQETIIPLQNGDMGSIGTSSFPTPTDISYQEEEKEVQQKVKIKRGILAVHSGEGGLREMLEREKHEINDQSDMPSWIDTINALFED